MRKLLLVIFLMALLASSSALAATVTEREEVLLPSEAAALLSAIPAEKTGLSKEIGAYDIRVAEGFVDHWFFSVEAYERGSAQLAASFYVAADQSAVFRLDGLASPRLIGGSAQPMLNAKALYEEEARIFVTEEEGQQGIAGADAPIVLKDIPAPVSVSLHPEGAHLLLGDAALVEAMLPGGLAYSLRLTSSDPAVLLCEGDTVTAAGVGEATVLCRLTVQGASRVYAQWLRVFPAELAVTEIPKTLKVGEEILLEAFAEAYGMYADWEVSDEELATLSYSFGYYLTAREPGVVTVTARAKDMTYEQEITITN